jgi:hypothetical protein
MKHEGVLQCARMETCIPTNDPSVQGVEDYAPMVGPLDSVVCSHRELLLVELKQQNCGT